MSFDFTDDHADGIGHEAVAAIGVEPVDGLDQTHPARPHDVLVGFAATAIVGGQRFDQP